MSHGEDRLIVNQNVSRATSSTTLVNTSVACIAASVVTYPFHQLHSNWQTSALAKWADQDFQTVHRSRLRRIISPLSRLVAQEAALAWVTDPLVLKHKQRDAVLEQVTAGVISGIGQALVLCPLEVHRAVVRKNLEQGKSRWFQPLLPQGRVDPRERLKRAYGGIGLLAVREVVFNVTFFPLALYLKQQPGWTKSKKVNLVMSNVLAGAACSITVLPLDVLRTYMWHSAERWSFWTGKSVVAPPLPLLFRGWTIQAFILGPAFGLVASIYDLT